MAAPKQTAAPKKTKAPKQTATPKQTTFKRKQEAFDKLVNRLHREFSTLDKGFVANIAMFVHCLPAKDTYDIDELVFNAEMLKTFGLDDPLIMNRMYAVCKNCRDPKAKVSVEDFCKLICIFTGKDLDKQIEFVFKVYDINNDGQVDQSEMTKLLRNTVLKMVDDYSELDESVREVMEVVLAVTDTDKNKMIDLEEYRVLVNNNILMLQCLGPCLPPRVELDAFISKIKGLPKEDVAEKFKNERILVLGDKEIPQRDSLYPIRLEMI